MASRVVKGNQNLYHPCPYCRTITAFHKNDCDTIRENWVWDPLAELQKLREKK